MNTTIMHETTAGSLAGTMAFPEVVQKLTCIGLESYHVDLIRRQKTFYMPDGRTHVEGFDFEALRPAENYSGEDVAAAIRGAQQGRVKYPEFLRLVLAAGVTAYTIYIVGRKAIYFGRKGDLHVENFPGN